jgi:hypothetical protein
MEEAGHRNQSNILNVIHETDSIIFEPIPPFQRLSPMESNHRFLVKWLGRAARVDGGPFLLVRQICNGKPAGIDEGNSSLLDRLLTSNFKLSTPL